MVTVIQPSSSVRRSRAPCPVQHRFCPRQPEAHVHVAVHGSRRGQMLLSSSSLAGADMELAELETALCDKGTHAELMRQRPGFAVGAFGLWRVEWIALRGDLA